MNNTIDILGTKYKLYRFPKSDERFQHQGVAGRCDSWLKEISICSSTSMYGRDNKFKSSNWFYAHDLQVLKHEIVHAFLNESGLQNNCCGATCWTRNEEMIDWFAIQGSKIVNAFSAAEMWLLDEIYIHEDDIRKEIENAE